MKKLIFLPIFITVGLLAFERLDAAQRAKCPKLQSYVLACKNKLYSQESKSATFMNAVRIERGWGTLLFGDRMDYGAAQFWLDHGVEVSQELKDNKLREAIWYKTCAGIKFWLDNGASLTNLTKDNRKNGLVEGEVWTEIDSTNQKMKIITALPGRPASGLILFNTGGNSYEKILDLLKDYDVSEIISPYVQRMQMVREAIREAVLIQKILN